jgi:hypothetical protein
MTTHRECVSMFNKTAKEEEEEEEKKLSFFLHRDTCF